MYSVAFAFLNSGLSYRNAKSAFEAYLKMGNEFFISYPKFKQICLDSHIVLEKEQKSVLCRKLYATLISDLNYPTVLKETVDAPILLYSSFPLADSQKFITVIGSRSYTPDGDRYCFDIVSKIAQYYPGYAIVTASVNGIASRVRDYAAQFNVPTVTVLASGYKTMSIYSSALPFSNTISMQLCIHSVDKMDYSLSNLLLAGISDKVVIVEAGEKSGCLEVAQKALDYGHDVYTVVHPVLSPAFMGNYRLINEDIASDYNKLFQNPNL